MQITPAGRAECLHNIEDPQAADLSSAVIRAGAQLRPDGAVDALLEYLPFAENDKVGAEVETALVAVALAEWQAGLRLGPRLTDPRPVAPRRRRRRSLSRRRRGSIRRRSRPPQRPQADGSLSRRHGPGRRLQRRRHSRADRPARRFAAGTTQTGRGVPDQPGRRMGRGRADRQRRHLPPAAPRRLGRLVARHRRRGAARRIQDAHHDRRRARPGPRPDSEAGRRVGRRPREGVHRPGRHGTARGALAAPGRGKPQPPHRAVRRQVSATDREGIAQPAARRSRPDVGPPRAGRRRRHAAGLSSLRRQRRVHSAIARYALTLGRA